MGFVVLDPSGEYIKSVTKGSFIESYGASLGSWLINLGASIRITLILMGLMVVGIFLVWCYLKSNQTEGPYY
jgi:hypothetical protein